MTTVRPYDDRDHDAVLALGVRLTHGAPPWRDAERWRAAVLGWVAEWLDAAHSPTHAVFVAVGDQADEQQDVLLGFVAVSARTHATGDIDAYVGELVVAEAATRRGVGRALLAAAESWARTQGFRVLSLETEGANTAARGLYASEGFVEEEVRLSKVLGPPPD
jgi:ribosomal protein S18 acetylase RimI-like enzyme